MYVRLPMWLFHGWIFVLFLNLYKYIYIYIYIYIYKSLHPFPYTVLNVNLPPVVGRLLDFRNLCGSVHPFSYILWSMYVHLIYIRRRRAEPLCARIESANREVSEGKADL